MQTKLIDMYLDFDAGQSVVDAGHCGVNVLRAERKLFSS